MKPNLKIVESNIELIRLVKLTVVAQDPKGIEDYVHRIPPMMLERIFKSCITEIVAALLYICRSEAPIAIVKDV